MNNKIFILALSTMLHAPCFSVEAQQPKLPRVGYLGGSGTANPARLEAFRLGLRELGYVEGKSIRLELRFPEGDSLREHTVAAELVRLNVDVIVTVGSNATRAAKEATATIPIVMTQDPDPVGNKFVDSLGRPGGNITGLSNFNRELSGKRLELLKETVPRLSRVAVFGTSTQPGHPQARNETELASTTLGVKLQLPRCLGTERYQSRFPSRSQRARRSDSWAWRCGNECTTICGCRICGKAPAPGNVQHSILCRTRRADELRREHNRSGSARSHICGQDLERCKARRSAGRTADKV